VFCLKVVAREGTDALGRVLQVLRLHSMVPRRVTAQHVALRGPGILNVLEIEIELRASEHELEAVRMIAARINQLPVVLAVVLDE
jgi:hypothetical protein